MVKRRFLLIGASLLVACAGIYYMKDALIGAFSNAANFLADLSADANADAPGGKKSVGDARLFLASENSVSAPPKKCSFETSEAPKRNSVILNEIAWMGTTENAKSEWIELKNVSSGTAALGGSRLLNQNGKIEIVFGAGAKITAGGFYLLGREKNIGAGVEADLTYRGTLRNSGDSLRLFDGDCHLTDEVIAVSGWPAGSETSKKTMERDPETLAWRTSALAGGTPKKENTRASVSSVEPFPKPSAAGVKTAVQATAMRQSNTSTNTTAVQTSTNQPAAANAQPPLCPATSPRTLSHSVLLNEVAWAGVSVDKTSEEWIELKNNYGSRISIEGWQLQNQSQNIKVFFGAADSIPAGGFYLLERGSVDFIQGLKADKFFVNAVKNSDESIRLFDKNCDVIDEAIANVGADKNWPAGTGDPAYRTAERSPDLSWHTYNGSGANGIFGTPLAENSSPPAPTASSGPSAAANFGSQSQPSPSLTLQPSLSPTPPTSTPPSARSNVNHIVISQIQITGGAGHTENDFVEVYNPTASQFNLKGYRLVKRTKTGTSDTLIKSWTADTFIPIYGFYLWANSGYTAIPVTPNATTTASIADDDGIAIRFGSNDTGTIIDSVAWGNTQNAFVEGSAFATNPSPNQSILRKSWQDACVAASFDASVGNGCDTNNNASDFELKSSQPRNSQIR